MTEVGELEERIVVRGLKPEDLEAVIVLDAKNVGRRREDYFKFKLQQNLTETGIKVSLAAETDGCFCGFLLARVYYGEFGTLEPVAVLDTLDVNPDFRRQGIGAALLGQLCKNLRALNVSRVRTEVGWDNQELLAFFHRKGFRPAERLCLDLDLFQ
jgi:ribosomal protein S18 acetylase RimI-like enzyme